MCYTINAPAKINIGLDVITGKEATVITTLK